MKNSIQSEMNRTNSVPTEDTLEKVVSGVVNEVFVKNI